MCSPGSSCWGLLENQTAQFRPNTTPGPLSIAFFFLGFIVINHSIRRLFLSRAEGREQMNHQGDSRESKSARADNDRQGKDEEQEEEEEEAEDGTASKEVMRMMLLQNHYPSSQHVPPHHRLTSDPIAGALLADSALSLSTTPIPPPASTPLASTWVDSHRNFIQPFHPADLRSSATPNLTELSDSCSESTTSA